MVLDFGMVMMECDFDDGGTCGGAVRSDHGQQRLIAQTKKMNTTKIHFLEKRQI